MESGKYTILHVTKSNDYPPLRIYQLPIVKKGGVYGPMSTSLIIDSMLTHPVLDYPRAGIPCFVCAVAVSCAEDNILHFFSLFSGSYILSALLQWSLSLG